MSPSDWLSRFLIATIVLILAGCLAQPLAQPSATATAEATHPPATATAEATRPPATPTEAVVLYHNEALGLQITDDFGLELVEDQVLNGRDYGITLQDPAIRQGTGQPGFQMRVAMLLNGTDSGEAAVAALRADFPGFDIQPTPITVDGYEGLLVEGLPGRTGASYVYLVANGHLYEILYHAERLDDDARTVLESLRVVPPTATIESLGLSPLAP